MLDMSRNPICHQAGSIRAENGDLDFLAGIGLVGFERESATDILN
jgi:hypothetical protein